jgi:hypothetical protein
MPSPMAAGEMVKVNRFSPSMAKANPGPRVRAAMVYSPPVSGNAADSSA